jgi:toxin ParE1/3/4
VGLNIIYSKFALRDLKEIYDYIRRDSLFYAKKEVQSIRATIQKLKSHPLMGKKFEKFNDELTRELVYKNYRIIYDLVPDEQIVVLTIHHHSRLISNNPAFRDEE